MKPWDESIRTRSTNKLFNLPLIVAKEEYWETKVPVQLEVVEAGHLDTKMND